MNLIYIGDPMCSWCYGFGKQLSAVVKAVPDLPLEIVVGGVRAGATDVLDDAGKRFRLSHWARVEEASGLPFNRQAFSARQGFVYDTEPICRAVVTARRVAPEAPLLDVFRALQHAFYVDGLDTTNGDVLATVTADALSRAGHAVGTAAVLAAFSAEATIAETRADFAKARSWGVSSFPSLLLKDNDTLQPVSPGYMDAETLLGHLHGLLERAAIRDPGPR